MSDVRGDEPDAPPLITIELVRHDSRTASAIDKLTTEMEQHMKLYMERCKLLVQGLVAGEKAARFAADDDRSSRCTSSR